ncbi:glutaredoxin family protein [Melaminivora sp.]|uniref:glutaredoxin family protein n=1 Tax=Melaminivora sp. TaxID=1933032 RepID=UPI0028AD297C|nr:glutaredoxin family protein [Melaminivora sp.]
MRPARLPALCALCAVVALLAAGAAQAQRIYRIIEPNGRVTFTDRPPTADARDITLPPNVQRPGGDAPLPPLRPAGQRPPVTLYTAADCVPCVSARALLEQRGIAFSEHVVASGEDLQALQRLSGDATLPFATVGERQLRGFSQQEWSDVLDAAGYAPRERATPAPPAS